MNCLREKASINSDEILSNNICVHLLNESDILTYESGRLNQHLSVSSLCDRLQ